MAKNISTLNIALNATVAPFASGLKKAEGYVGSFASKVVGIGATLATLSGVGAVVGGALGTVFALGKGFSLAASLEQTQVAFETMLGSADKAKTLMGQLQQFAASTPFQFPELAESAKKLLAFGDSADQITPHLKSIGDIAAGVGAPISELAELFGKAKVQGTLYAEDINQLLGRGIPVIKEFAKQLGVSESEVKKMASEGKINFGMLEKAFTNLTSNGGQFSGMMDKQAGTVSGLLSTLTDNVEMGLAGIATTIMQAFNFSGAIGLLISASGTLASTVNGWITNIAPTVKAFGISVYSTFAGIYARIAPSLAAAWNVVQATFVGIVNVISSLSGTALGVVQGIWSGIYGVVAPIVAAVYNTVATNWQAMALTVIEVGQSIYDFVSAAWGLVWELATRLWQGVTQVWGWGTSLITGQTQETANSVPNLFGVIVDAGKWLADQISLTLQIFSFGMNHLEEVADAVCVAIGYSIVKLGNQIAYVFTDVIPATAKWLGTIFLNLGSFTAHVAENMATNIWSVFKNLPGLISGSTNWNQIWTPLTDGFTNTMQALPQIADRQVGGMEKALGDESDRLNNKLSQGLGQYLVDQEKQAKAAAKSFTDPINKALDQNKKPIIPTIKPPEVPQVPPIALNATINPDNLTVGVTPEIKQAKLVRFGSAEQQADSYNGNAIKTAARATQPGGIGMEIGMGGLAAAPQDSGNRTLPVFGPYSGNNNWLNASPQLTRGPDTQPTASAPAASPLLNTNPYGPLSAMPIIAAIQPPTVTPPAIPTLASPSTPGVADAGKDVLAETARKQLEQATKSNVFLDRIDRNILKIAGQDETSTDTVVSM